MELTTAFHGRKYLLLSVNMVFLANELIQSYGGFIILILVAILGFVSYQMYNQRHQTQTGKKLTSNVVKVLKRNGCKIKGDRVTCHGPEFAGLGQKFTIPDAVDKVVDMISAEMGGPPAPPPRIPENPYPSQASGPPPHAPVSQAPPGAGRQMPRGPPEAIQTNPKRAAMGQGGPMSMPGPAPAGGPGGGPAGGGFGGLMSVDGEPLGRSLAGSDPMGGDSVGGMAYNPNL